MGAKNIQIFNGEVNDPENLFPVFNVKDKEDTMKSLDEFAKYFQGKFTAFVRTDSNQQRKSGERVLFSHYPGNDDARPVNGISHGFNPEELRKQWEAEQAQKEKENRLINELAELRREINDQRKPEAKLMSIFEKMIEHFDWDFVKPRKSSTVIQGTTTQQQSTSMGHFNMDDLNEKEQDQVEDAFATIYSHMGKDLLIRVADAIAKNPSLVKKLDLFI